MKILINTSNLQKGGAIQVAHSFLNEIKEVTLHEFFIVVSSSMYNQLDISAYKSVIDVIKYDNSPGIIKAITGYDKFLKHLEKKINPDCVFTLFGPSNWRPKAPHLIGIANGWWYNPDNPVWNNLSYNIRLLTKFKHFIQKRQIIREGDFFVVETEDAKQRVNKYLKIDISKISVVGNTYNQIFDQSINISDNNNFNSTYFKLITVSAFYSHKNLKIIPDVLKSLRKRGVENIKFFLTIPQEIFKKEFSDYSSIENLGPLKVQELPLVYSQMDAVFLPTLLETFSASYPEAMKMGKPILTSDLSFAHDICGKSAEYFDPLNPEDIADRIELIISSKDRRDLLKLEGFKQLKSFDTAKTRTFKYLEICKFLYNQKKTISY